MLEGIFVNGYRKKRKERYGWRKISAKKFVWCNWGSGGEKKLFHAGRTTLKVKAVYKNPKRAKTKKK